MNRITLIIIGIAFFINYNSFGQSEWKTYEYNNQNFKISFFQQPETSVDSAEFEDSYLKTYYWEVDITDSLHGNTYYSISAETYPSDFIHSDSAISVVEGFINSSQNSLIDDSDFSIISSSLDEKYGFPCKTFKWKSNINNNFIQFQVYLIDNTLFQLAVVSKASDGYNLSIKKYFDSFILLDNKKGGFSMPEISKENNYEINFPGTPTDQSKTVDTETGKLFLNIQVYEAEENSANLAYIAMQTKYDTAPADQNSTYSLNTFYKRSIDASLAAVNGELISMTNIYYNDKLGKEYKAYVPGGKVIMVYRVYYIDDNYYSIGAVTKVDNDNNKEMKKFFKSFKIKE